MEVKPLQFTKDWKNPGDFPTVELEEEKVRADMQQLHDETRDYLNGTMTDAVLQLSTRRENILFNPLLTKNALIDQRGGYVVPAGVAFTVPGQTAEAGKTDKYYAVTKFAADETAVFLKGGVEYAVHAEQAVRGYTGVKYGFSRWQQNANVCSCLDDTLGLRIVSNETTTSSRAMFWQSVKNKFAIGTPLTVSCLCTGRSVAADTWAFRIVTKDAANSSVEATQVFLKEGLNEATLVPAKEFAYVRFEVLSTASKIGDFVTLSAVKMECGDASTLARREGGRWVLNDPAPDHYLELLKCCMSDDDSEDALANNNQTPAAVNAVSRAGDRMTGPLDFDYGARGRMARFFGDYGYPAAMVDSDDSFDSFTGICVNDSPDIGEDFLHLIRRKGGSLHKYALHHDGNRPRGAYTGDGRAVRRIQLSCACFAVLIVGDNGVHAIVSPFCALIWGYPYVHSGTLQGPVLTAPNAKIQEYSVEECSIVLTDMANTLNADGVEYTYQVL